MNTKKLLAVLLLNSVVFGGGVMYFYSQYKNNIYYSNSVLILPNGSQTLIVPSAQLDAGAKFKPKSAPASIRDMSYTPTASQAPSSSTTPVNVSTGTSSNTLSSTYAYNGSNTRTTSKNTSSAVGSGVVSSAGMPLLGGRKAASTQLVAFSGSATSDKVLLTNTPTSLNAPTATDGTNGDIIIDPETDPTGPPIPVGDGLTVLLILSVAYAGVWKRLRK